MALLPRLRRRLRPPPGPVAVGVDVFVADDEVDQTDGIVAALVVDGTRLPPFDYGPLDLVALHAACERPGLYFIWTCTCGDPGCGGYFRGVQVTHDGELTHWDNGDAGQRYCFRRSDLWRAVREAHRAGRELRTIGSWEFTPDGNAEFFDREPDSL
jgi:hypothetical protein